MPNKIICTPNFELPQKIDLNLIRDEFKQRNIIKAADKCLWETDDSDFDSKNTKPFDVLPLYSPPNEALRKQLSLQHNKYLSKKFNQFLNNMPTNWTNVRLYEEIRNMRNKSIPHRMKLNGRFYDVDNKLAPAPVLSDPRQYCKKTIDCKKMHRKSNN